MRTQTTTHPRLDGAGWVHPYPTRPFDPYLYADGGAADDPGSSPGEPPVAEPAASREQPGQRPDVSGQDVSTLPDWAQKVIADARAEAGKARTVAKQNAAQEARQQLTTDIGKALGLIEGEKAPTPEELTAQLRDSHGALTAAREEAAAAAIELHVYRTASKLGADADALLDSRAFCDTIDAIPADSDAEAFSAAVRQAIEAAMGRNPALRARTAGRSGADHGAGGEVMAGIDKQIADAISRRDFPTAIRLKRQRAAQT